MAKGNAMKKGMKRVGGKRTPDLERIAKQPPPTKEKIDQWRKEQGAASKE